MKKRYKIMMEQIKLSDARRRAIEQKLSEEPQSTPKNPKGGK